MFYTLLWNLELGPDGWAHTTMIQRQVGVTAKLVFCLLALSLLWPHTYLAISTCTWVKCHHPRVFKHHMEP